MKPLTPENSNPQVTIAYRLPGTTDGRPYDNAYNADQEEIVILRCMARHGAESEPKAIPTELRAPLKDKNPGSDD